MESPYFDIMKSASSSGEQPKCPTGELTLEEIAKIRQALDKFEGDSLGDLQSTNSVYEEFPETTHAWAIFADHPENKASTMDRLVGCMIIIFQLFTYWLFASEAIEDYKKGVVPVTTTHDNCIASNEAPYENFTCEAEYTNNVDAFVAFFMLGIFLASDFQQAGRALRKAPFVTPFAFASLAGIEVVCAFFAASISISQKLFIGEVTDAIEVGVGLLFIRELSTRAYHGIQQKKKKQYRSFFGILAGTVVVGMLMDPACEALFGP
jgi:hypothetical protein